MEKDNYSLFDKIPSSRLELTEDFDSIQRERIIDWFLGLSNDQQFKVILDTISDIDSDRPLGDHGFEVQITLEEALRKKLREKRVHLPEGIAKDFIDEQSELKSRVIELERIVKEK